MLQIVCIVVIICVFLIASYKDYKTRVVPFETWYPLIVINAPITIYYIVLLSLQNPVQLVMQVAPALLITGSIYLIGWYRFIGGADAWAMIFIYLFAILPLGATYIDFIYIMLQASIIGIIFIGFTYIKKRSWEKIPYIPALTASLIYFLFFGAPL